MARLTVNNLVKSYNKRLILKSINLHFATSEIVGLFGPNGAGKTTCFDIIAGLIKADSGELLLNGFDISNSPVHEKAKMGLSYLPQESSIFRGLSVYDNIKLVLEITEKDQTKIDEKTLALLDEFSLLHLKEINALNLSGGERRRLEIARALALSPRFIMLDEPFAGIDPLVINDIKKLIKQLKEKNIGVLITDHNVRETLDIVDRAYIIYEGKVLLEGTPDSIISNNDVKNYYLGESFKHV